jgi:hypothetical protein
MKKLVILSAIAMSGLLYNKANAQISINFGVHIPVHRVYVPAPRPVVVEQAPVYDDENVQADYNDNGDDYYYLPEVEAYYSLSGNCYYYNDGSRWITCAYLPGAYRNYDWRTGVRYEVRGSRPYLRHDVYRSRWGGYAGDRGNWGHRFDRRYDGGYAYRGRQDNRFDNRGWDRGNRNNDRGNWNQRPAARDQGNWGGRPDNDNQNHGNWGGGQPNHDNGGGRDHNNGNGNWGGGDHGNGNHGNNGGNQPSNNHGGGQDRGGRGNEHFAANRGFGVRH